MKRQIRVCDNCDKPQDPSELFEFKHFLIDAMQECEPIADWVDFEICEECTNKKITEIIERLTVIEVKKRLKKERG